MRGREEEEEGRVEICDIGYVEERRVMAVATIAQKGVING